MRMAAAVALAAIALVAILALVHERRGGVRSILVAQLHASDRQSNDQDLPAFAVAIDQTAHKLVVNPVSIEDRHGTRYSLWVVRTGDERPVTRATLSATDATVLPWRASVTDLVGAHVRISTGEDWTAPQPWGKTASFFEGVLVRPPAR
jgi:anti-sigma-K factor RskA